MNDNDAPDYIPLVKMNKKSRLMHEALVLQLQLIEDAAEARMRSQSNSPSEGIFYLVQYPYGWQVFPLFPEELDYFFTEDPCFIWALVSTKLAHEWHDALGIDNATLTWSLRRHSEAFPRGKVSADEYGARYTVAWGEPIPESLPGVVQHLYGLPDNTFWAHDRDYAACAYTKNCMRYFLKPSEDWHASRSIHD